MLQCSPIPSTTHHSCIPLLFRLLTWQCRYSPLLPLWVDISPHFLPPSLSPVQSRMLVLEHGLLSVILNTLQDLLLPCKDPTTGCLKLRPSNYKHSRIFYIVYDLRCVTCVAADRSECGMLQWLGTCCAQSLKSGHHLSAIKCFKRTSACWSWWAGCKMLILSDANASITWRERSPGNIASTSVFSCNQPYSSSWSGASLMYVHHHLLMFADPEPECMSIHRLPTCKKHSPLLWSNTSWRAGGKQSWCTSHMVSVYAHISCPLHLCVSINVLCDLPALSSIQHAKKV